MNKLPEQYIDTKTTPLSLMEPEVEYLVYYDSLILDSIGVLWVRKNEGFGSELTEWEDENAQVYIKRTDRGIVVRIPPTFSKRKKWTRHEWVDYVRYIRIDEITVG